MVCRLLQAVAALLAVALTLVAVGIYREPPPSLLPPPADASACVSQAPEPKPGPPHIRKGAEFDIVVYGATGFVGNLASHYLALAPGSFTFAIAGRDWGRLDKLDSEINKKVKEAGRGRESAAMLVAASKDADGLRKIARKARVVLAAAGPYTKHGSKLLQVCAEEGTHYVDVSGEFFWMRKMIDSNAAKAQFSGAKVVVAAGYDSAPFDVGAAVALRALDAQAAGGKLARNVTVRAVVTGMRGGISGGTIASGKATEKQVSSGKVPTDWQKDPYLLAPTASCPTDAIVDGWGQPRYDQSLGVAGVPHIMAGTNARIVRRSLELLGRRGVSYGEGMSLGGILDAASFALRWSRSMSLNPPVGEGPPPAVQLAGGYEASVVARDEASGRAARVELRGRGDPGYMHTSRIMAEVGLCLLDASCHRAGMGGGIHTPVSATDLDALINRFRTAKHEDGGPLLTVEVAGGAGKHAGEL